MVVFEKTGNHIEPLHAFLKTRYLELKCYILVGGSAWKRMLVVKTRSSRFFIVVLHLVCVSTRLRSKEITENQSFIFFRETAATIQTQTFHTAASLASLTESTDQNAATHDTNRIEPCWLQDAFDQKCLGPMGHFSECGDANLWRIIPKSKRHARRRQWIRWAIEDDSDGLNEVQGFYALQIFDMDSSQYYDSKREKTAERNEQETLSSDSIAAFMNTECLTRRRKDNKLVTVPCSEDRAWYWKINEYGILHFQKPARGFGASSRRGSSGNKKSLLNKRQNLESCVWMKNSSIAALSPCDGNQPFFHEQNKTSFSHSDSNSEGRVAQLQFVRHNYQRDIDIYRPLPSKFSKAVDDNKIQGRVSKHTIEEREKAFRSSRTLVSSSGNTNLPSQVGIAHSHASVPSDHVDSQFTNMKVASILPHRSSEIVSKQIPQFLGNTNPILLAIGPKLTPTIATKTMSSSSTTTTKIQEISGAKKKINIGKESNRISISSSLPEKPIVRKIQTNPYIAASKDEKWIDPQTGLVYKTDLCQYLGHERKEVGRHTLTGVGQYTKTMLNIKVYGVGFYVSKRDILADPSFEPYASLSSEGLRQNESFFRVLRSMRGFTATDDSAGKFDRTVFLKINMQLSTETMRSSLNADWKMLTPEAKQLLIGSSMKQRPADPIFLEIAKSPDNPNRCTCAQIAPEEYDADPSCCARGTELAFTWRKNGDLEVRLNGVFVDSFPRPDIAEGIFFEYLRLDDPMSFDFLDRVVDGFPSLLAPLSQVRGVSTPTIMHQTSIQNQNGPGANPLIKMIGGFGGAISSQAATLAEFVQSGTQELAGSAIDKARSVGSTARNIGEEVERRRDLIGKHVSSFTNQALSSLVPASQKSLSIPFPGWISDNELENLPDDLFRQNSMTSPNNGSGYSRTISRIIGLEDDSLSASNITQKLFFGLVHLYLLLLLIASFPAQWTTRTKIVISRKDEAVSPNAGIPTDSENSDSDESGSSSIEMPPGKEIRLQKSLSYVL